MAPRMVTLRLTDPRMGAPARDGNQALVRAVQNRLRGYGLEQDGAFGPRTSLAVAIWQERAGAPNIAGAITPAELLVLLGYRKVPRDWIPPRRDLERKRAAAAHQERLAALAAAERPPATQVLRIIPREQWCTTPARGASVAQHGPGVGHVVHWFGPGRAADTLAGGIAQANSFARYHIITLGWADIGYGWLILRDGRDGQLCTVLEGRGRNVRGAHSGHNVANAQPGVCLLAGTESPEATPEQLLTLQALRTAERWGRRTGHIEWHPTTCPGPEIQPWVIANR